MITIEVLASRIGRASVDEIEAWIGHDWIRAEGVPGHYVFSEIDVARAGLIVELREDLGVGDDALSLVLSLLDQLYAARREMRLVAAALDGATSDLDPDGSLVPLLREAMLRRLPFSHE